MNQPPHPDHRATVADILNRLGAQPGALLPVLHAVQEALGFIPADQVGLIAEGLNLSRAEVHGVITYYDHFRTQPHGRHVVQVCRAEACQACGGQELLERASELLGCAVGETRADGFVTLEPVYCLGLCASSPALQVDERLHARVTPQRLAAIARQLEEAR